MIIKKRKEHHMLENILAKKTDELKKMEKENLKQKKSNTLTTAIKSLQKKSL